MADSYADHQTLRSDKRYTYDGHHIISDQVDRTGIKTVCDSLEKVLKTGVDGHIVELGCYVGTTSVFIRRLLDKYSQSETREFHVYDSFAGLPDKHDKDQNAAGIDFKAGELFATKKELIRAFASQNLKIPSIHKGWFSELKEDDIPQPLAFAFLDGDFYESILDSLRLVWPKMSEGSYVLIDDYMNPSLPGVEKAVAEFFQGKRLRLQRSGNIAIIEV